MEIKARLKVGFVKRFNDRVHILKIHLSKTQTKKIKSEYPFITTKKPQALMALLANP